MAGQGFPRFASAKRIKEDVQDSEIQSGLISISIEYQSKQNACIGFATPAFDGIQQKEKKRYTLRRLLYVLQLRVEGTTSNCQQSATEFGQTLSRYGASYQTIPFVVLFSDAVFDTCGIQYSCLYYDALACRMPPLAVNSLFPYAGHRAPF